MSILTVASIIQTLPLAIGAMAANLAFLRQREPQRIYFVGILAGISFGFVLLDAAVISGDLAGGYSTFVVRIGDALLLLGMFTFFLFTSSFFHYPKSLTLLAGAHYLIVLLLIAAGDYKFVQSSYGTVIDRSAAMLIAESSFAAAWLGFCSIVFWRRGAGLTGLMRGRLQLIAISGFLALLSGVLYPLSLFVKDAVPLVLASTVVGTCAGTGYYFGFVTPHWLRRRFMSSQQDMLALSTHSLVSGMEIEELLQLLVKDAVHLLGVNAGILGIWMQRKNEMVIEAVQGLEAIKPGTVLKPEESFVIQSIIDNRPVVLCDAVDELMFSQNQLDDGAGSLIAVPIIMKDRLIGGLALFFDRGPFLSQEDANLLTLFAEQAAVAIHNASLYLEAEKRASELEALNNLAIMTSRSLDSETILRDGLRLAGSILKFDAGAVFLRHEEDGKLATAAQWNIPQEVMEQIVNLDENGQFVVRVALSGEPLLIDNVRVGANANGQLAAGNYQSLAGAPLKAKDTTLGVILLIGKSARTFSGEDVGLLTSIASQISMAVENARLYQNTDRQLQEKVVELTGYKAMLESTIQSISHGLIVFDMNNRLIYANRVIHHLFGLKEESFIGLTADQAKKRVETSFGNPEAAEKVFAITDKDTDEDYLAYFEIASPSHSFIERTTTPVMDAYGKQLGRVIVFRDITEERETERIKDEFLGMISHELRTPLTAILGYTDIMLRRIPGGLTPEQETFENSVKHNALRLLALINDLLDLSRIETGRIALLRGAVRLQPVIRKALERSAMLARAKKLTIEVDVPDDLPEIDADGNRLLQIMENLLSNAVKFTMPGGKVSIKACVLTPTDQAWIETDDLPPSILISVGDSGIGISTQHLDRIWEPFQQADSSSNRRFGGMGLGLSITKNLVELHGGRIWAESEGIPGKGSTFFLALPLVGANTGSEVKWVGHETFLPSPPFVNG